MSNKVPIDREGIFKAQISEFGLADHDSGSVSLSVRADLLEMWDQSNQEWIDWRPYSMEAEGFICIVKTDGALNKNQALSLVKHAGWDGDFASLNSGSWQPAPCQMTIKNDTYKNKSRLRINFINGYDRTPGQFSTLDDDKVNALQTRLGGELRALAGNVKRNGPTTPAGKPTAPPRSLMPTPTAHDPSYAPPARTSGEEIPF